MITSDVISQQQEEKRLQKKNAVCHWPSWRSIQLHCFHCSSGGHSSEESHSCNSLRVRLELGFVCALFHRTGHKVWPACLRAFWAPWRNLEAFDSPGRCTQSRQVKGREKHHLLRKLSQHIKSRLESKQI